MSLGALQLHKEGHIIEAYIKEKTISLTNQRMPRSIGRMKRAADAHRLVASSAAAVSVGAIVDIVICCRMAG